MFSKDLSIFFIFIALRSNFEKALATYFVTAALLNAMNYVFVNVGPNLDKDIQNSTCSYFDFLGPSTHN